MDFSVANPNPNPALEGEDPHEYLYKVFVSMCLAGMTHQQCQLQQAIKEMYSPWVI